LVIPIEPDGQPVGTIRSKGHHIRRDLYEEVLIAVALIVSFAAPAMADNFPNLYASHLGR